MSLSIGMLTDGVRACAILRLRACVRAFMLYALNFDKYVFVKNV